ncbi:MAG: electron transport complex subunit E [Nanoarchaeota archaeon]|nr:electron transport complex subunit E [Nanoarchaeota archaeon]MBU1704564.1 electron transport complex subunit E [Nanoarchaeota archaeon]
MGNFTELFKGLFQENPVFALVLGLCPTLAVSTSLDNAIGMGAAATFVLLCSNIIISLIRKQVPEKIRIPIYIVVIASFVTMASLFMQAFLPELNKALGIYVPLIVVNCIILGRAEAFASRNNAVKSAMDGIGMGVGFTLALALISIIRELLGTGYIKLFGITLIAIPIEPAMIFILAPGALLVMGLLLALFAQVRKKKYEVKCCEVKE